MSHRNKMLPIHDISGPIQESGRVSTIELADSFFKTFLMESISIIYQLLKKCYSLLFIS